MNKGFIKKQRLVQYYLKIIILYNRDGQLLEHENHKKKKLIKLKIYNWHIFLYLLNIDYIINNDFSVGQLKMVRKLHPARRSPVAHPLNRKLTKFNNK